jgi:hypothetical protein
MKTNNNNHIIRGIKAACLAACVLIPVSVLADTPNTLNIQGQVDDITSGSGLQGNVDVRFTLYDISGRSTQYMDLGNQYVDPTGSGASVIWTSVINIAFENGIYSAQLGANIPFPVDSFISDSEVLGIQIGDDDELAPRLNFNATPYALRSNVSSNVDGDITPRSVSVADEWGNLMLVIDNDGQWQGHSAGLTGDQGPKGDDGADGSPGVQGPEGDDGADGSPGVEGPKGDDGADGSSGSNGSPGLVGSSVVTTIQCTSGTTCSCGQDTFLITAGASCAKNQYLYKSQPVLNSKTTWEAICEVFSTGVDANPASINLICAQDNDV